MRRLTRVLLMLLLAGVVTVILVAAALLVALRAQPGDWAQRVALGPMSVDVGVLAAIRIATHPLGMRALEGWSVVAPIGTLQFSAGPTPDSLRIACEPCRLDAPALSPRPLALPRAEATVLRSGANDLHGDLRAGSVASSWRAALHPRDLVLDVEIADAGIGEAYALFGVAIPEVARARIEGRLSG
ncbi:MAG: glycosyl transferase, partial [Planctomycetota bacterium]